MKRVWRALAASFRYFSVLPLGPPVTAPPDAPALLALPAVGATLGTLAGLAGVAAGRIGRQPLPGAVALGTLVVLSGAVHLDGFLDGCDALFASVSPARRLEILKDPHHGTFALAGLTVAGGLSYAALTALHPSRLPLALAYAGALARAAVVACAFAMPDARGVASRPAFASAAALPVLGGTFAALAAAAARRSRGTAASVPAALLGAIGIERWCARRLGGGLTGDAYGFGIVVLEAALVATLACDGA